jgi:hypothetical protein
MFVFLLGLLQWLVLRQVGFAGSMTFSEFLRSSSIRAATLFGVLGIWGAAFTVIVLGVLGEWVAASTIGMTVGGVLLEVMGIDLGENMVGLVIGAVLGASIGIAQWVVLQRHVSRAGWWILASTLSLAVGMAVGGIGAGALYGPITGGVMVWLLRQPARKEMDPRQAAV